MQGMDTADCPSQAFMLPPLAVIHTRLRARIPFPQVAEHGPHAPHWIQWPGSEGHTTNVDRKIILNAGMGTGKEKKNLK